MTIRDSHLEYIQLLVDGAMIFFNDRLRTPDTELVVFDIDGTVLDDTDRIPEMKDVYRGYAPMLKFYTALLEMGYKIIFLTARAENFRETTLFNLEYCGYHTFEALVMMPKPVLGVREICEWKDEQRRIFKEVLGYHLVCCIGDQDADTTGNHIGEYQIRIPPPPRAGQCSMM